MRVCVEEARKDRRLREIDDRGVRGDRKTFPDRLDRLVLDQDDLIPDSRPSLWVDHAARPDGDRLAGQTRGRSRQTPPRAPQGFEKTCSPAYLDPHPGSSGQSARLVQATRQEAALGVVL